MSGRRVTLVLAFWFWSVAGPESSFGADWPQWLGPNRNGISTDANRAPLSPAPRRLWTVSTGVGVSSVVVSDGRAFTLGHARGPRERGTDTVYALDADTGRVLWTHAYDCSSCKSQDVRFYGPRSTPTVDGDRLFTLSLAGHLFCFEAGSGTIRWSRELPRDLQGRVPLYGYCCSPLVYGDTLLLELNAPDASYVALDKSSGNVVWRRAGGDVTCGSPVLTRIAGVDCAVFMGGGTVMGVEAATGQQLWRHSTWGHAWMGPVVAGNEIFVANASLPRGCGLIRIEAGRPTAVWEDRGKKFQTLHCNAVIWQGHLYGFDNTGTDYQGKDSKKSSLKCLELDTGQVRWTEQEMGWGNLIVHDGKLIVLREAGELVVAKASPQGYEEFLRTPVLGGPAWTVPALADGKLYCRNNAGQLVCLQLFGESQEAARPAPPRETPTPPPVVRPPEPAVTRPQTTIAEPAGQDQWPRFRGPGGLGIAPKDEPGSPKRILWRSAVPLEGESSPVIWDTQVFLTGANRQKREVYCFDGQTGKPLWQREWPAPEGEAVEPPDGLLMAASTPVTDGRCVYALFGNGDVGCLDFQGEVKWSRSLGMPDDDYGHATSLERWEHLLLVQLDQGQAEDGRSKLLALHVESGRTVWETARPVPCSWSSPIVIEAEGQAQLVTCAEPWLLAYDPASGRELWRADCLGGQIVPSPIHANGLVYVVSPDACLAAVRPDGRGDVTRTHIAWTAEENLPSVCSPVGNGELIWLVDSGSVVTCYDARDGRKIWEKELGGSFQASPTVVGDLLYVLSEGGSLFVLEAGRQYALVDRIELGEACQASPAFRRGRLYVRTKRSLFCLGESVAP